MVSFGAHFTQMKSIVTAKKKKTCFDFGSHYTNWARTYVISGHRTWEAHADLHSLTFHLITYTEGQTTSCVGSDRWHWMYSVNIFPIGMLACNVHYVLRHLMILSCNMPCLKCVGCTSSTAPSSDSLSPWPVSFTNCSFASSLHASLPGWVSVAVT